MSKVLSLIHPVDEERAYTEGVNCDNIARVEGGYAITKGNTRRTIPDARVEVLTEVERPGVASEEASNMPSYVKQTAGGWGCKLCEKTAPTVHAIKTHHGMVHAEKAG